MQARVRTKLEIVILSLLSTFPLGGLAATETHAVRGYTDLVLAYNPPALAAAVGIAYKNTYHTDPSPLWNGLYWQADAHVGVNPAYSIQGIAAEWLPVGIFKIRLQVDNYTYFGRNGSLLSFQSANAKFGDAEVAQRKDQSVSGNGYRLKLQPTLQAKKGPFVVSNQFAYSYFKTNGDGPYYYERENDTLIHPVDQVVDNQLRLLYKFRGGITDAVLLGPFYQYTYAFGAKIQRQRAGLRMYVAPAKRYTFMNEPRIIAMIGANIQDRNRANTLFGSIGMGFAFEFSHRPMETK